MAQRLTASFRGVQFFVESSDISAGRRTVTHQYPQRDEPFTEDLGRAAREYEISAFVLGEDCVDQAYAVRDAIEQPGPGTLVHPEFGEVQVIARPGGSMSFSQTRRIVRFTLTFVEAGLNAFPEMGQATQSQSRAAADGLMSSACDAFAEAINLDAVEDFVKDALNGDLLDSLGIISNSEIAEVLGFADRVSDLANSAIDLVSTDPRAFATQLMGACGLSGLATTVAGWQRVGTSLCSLVDDLHGADDEPIYSQVKPHSAEVIETNREAVYALARSAILVQAVGVSTLIGTRTSTARCRRRRPSGAMMRRRLLRSITKTTVPALSRQSLTTRCKPLRLESSARSTKRCSIPQATASLRRFAMRRLQCREICQIDLARRLAFQSTTLERFFRLA